MFLESTYKIQNKISVDFAAFPDMDGDILLFACKYPIFETAQAKVQAIVASKVCLPEGEHFLFLEKGSYWIYALPVRDGSDEKSIHAYYTLLYKTPEKAIELGEFETYI